MNDPKLISPSEWEDYELIDCGDFEKLERFGDIITARPEPQAVWPKDMSDAEWLDMADAFFSKGEKKQGEGMFRRSKHRDSRQDDSFGTGEERGHWVLKPGTTEQWKIGYKYREMEIKLRLGLTAFKHVGVFPEQAENWKFIYNTTRLIADAIEDSPRVLNLFAYTGGATLAACTAGAKPTHVDSVKPVVSWARENMESSGLDGVRWIVEDALKFVKREAKRGNTYHGIILDPPAYGRGPDGEKWILERNFTELLALCADLLEPKNSFLVVNLYSMGLSALLARTAVHRAFGIAENDEGNIQIDEQFGELYFTDRFGKSLPLGVYYRFKR